MKASIWTPEEIKEAASGIWLTNPKLKWMPKGIRAIFPGRVNRPYSHDFLNFVFTPQQLVSARSHLNELSGGGALILREGLAQPADLTWCRLPILIFPRGVLPLENLAIKARNRFQGKIVLVVGSVGKTSSRLLIANALGATTKVETNFGNWNFRPHIYEKLCSIDPATDYFVVELGLGQKDASFQRTAKVLRPYVVVFTHLGISHVDMIADAANTSDRDILKKILLLKAEAFSGLDRFGMAVINHDMPFSTIAANLARQYTENVVTYGESEGADCRVVGYEESLNGGELCFEHAGERYHIELSVFGREPSKNSMSAWLIGRHFGHEPDKIAASISSFTGASGRSRVERITVDGKKIFLLDDTFNATPLSMKTCFSTAAQIASSNREIGRTVLVLGDILHLGDASARLHSGLVDDIVESGAELVFTRGEHMNFLFKALPDKVKGSHCLSNEELFQKVIDSTLPGDLIAIKASSPLKFREISDRLRLRNHDQE